MCGVSLDNMKYTKNTLKSFDEAVQAVTDNTREVGFRVLHVHNVQETLSEKGFSRSPMKIVELCNAGYADKALRGDVAVSLFMPCKIVVYEEDGQTIISALRPTVLADFFPGAGLDKVATEVDEKVRNIVDRSV